MTITTTTIQLRNRTPEATLPYSDKALSHALRRVHDQWREARREHDRLSIYQYLKAVFDLGMVWKKENDERDRAKRALRSAKTNLGVIEPFAAIIASTSSQKQVDPKARSKWARVLMFAAQYKSSSEPLADFIRSHGGLNQSAAEYSRRLGRKRSQAR